MSVRSPSGVSADSTASTPFETGRLSPVSADSAISSVAAREQAAVGRHDVAGLDRDDVPGDELLGRDLDELAVAAHARLDDHHLLERGDGLRRLALLAQAEHGVEERQEEQDEAGPELLERLEAADPGDEQDDLHRVAVLAHEGAPARLDLGDRERVRADRSEPRGGLGGREPARRCRRRARRRRPRPASAYQATACSRARRSPVVSAVAIVAPPLVSALRARRSAASSVHRRAGLAARAAPECRRSSRSRPACRSSRRTGRRRAPSAPSSPRRTRRRSSSAGVARRIGRCSGVPQSV